MPLYRDFADCDEGGTVSPPLPPGEGRGEGMYLVLADAGA